MADKFIIHHLSFSVACSDFLEIEPQEIIVLDKFWNEEADVENMVAGCYSTMQQEAVVSRMMAWGEFRSDNTVGGTGIENVTDLSNIFKENINASNSYAKWVTSTTSSTAATPSCTMPRRWPNATPTTRRANSGPPKPR